MTKISDTVLDVLVVGAGPTGLATAVALIAQGCGKVVVVDALPQGQNTSRAAVIHALTLETLEPTGVVPALIAKGVHAPGAVLSDGRKTVLQVSFGNLPSKYNYALCLSQADTESLLADRLTELGGSVHWSKKVQSVTNINESTRKVTFEDGDVVEAKYIVAADGLHSIVRQQANIPYKDPTPGRPDDYYVMQLNLMDVRIKEPFDDPNCVRGYLNSVGIFGMLPLPDGSYRMFAGFPKETEIPREPSREFVQDIFNKRGLGHRTVEEVPWGSRFRVRSRIADTFFLPGKDGQGGIILAGDAAHTHSPAGGQGMNLGLCDAVFLAEAVKKHQTTQDDAVLRQYSEERKKRALEIIALSERLSVIGGGISGWRATIMKWAATVIGYIPGATNAAAKEMAGLNARRG